MSTSKPQASLIYLVEDGERVYLRLIGENQKVDRDIDLKPSTLLRLVADGARILYSHCKVKRIK